MTAQRLDTWTVADGILKRRGQGAIDTFTLGVTKPVLVDPMNPTITDNVGAAFGYNGVSLTTVTGDFTIPANTTVTDKRFQGFVTFTDATSQAVNCVFEGRAPGGAFSSGLAKGAAGGTLDRCTLAGTAVSDLYYMDGIESTGGTWTLTRCSISQVVDSTHANGGTIKMHGCKLGPYSFHDDDANHTSDSVHPWWGHGDTGLQRLTGNANNDEIIGCNIVGYFDTTGVTFTGGQYVNGASTFGNPAAAMNGNAKDTAGTYQGNGTTTQYVNGNYANIITYSNTSPFTGMLIDSNWIDGGSYPSGLIQLTTGTGHSLTITNNRFGLGGRAGGGANTIFLVSYPNDTVCTHLVGGVESNVLDPDNPYVPLGQRGQALTWTSGGTKVTGVTIR